MFDSGEKTTKARFEATIELVDGSSVLGVFFVSPQARLSDLLNDQREFLPIEMTDGSITVVRKSSIVRATPLRQEALNGTVDPYTILNVKASVSYDELKAAYHAMCREYHPDKLQSLGLPNSMVDFGNAQMARINDAFQRICREKNFRTEEEVIRMHG